MHVSNISSTNFGAGVKIFCNENKHHPFLYNELEGIRKEFKIPATFHTEEVELPSISKAIIKRLQDLGINFSSK